MRFFSAQKLTDKNKCSIIVIYIKIAVMENQADLVKVVATLKQVLCVKG